MSRQRHAPTDKLRSTIRSMSACGIPQEEIGEVLSLDSKTLRKYYRKELDTAAIMAKATIGAVLYNKALGGDTTSLIFWLKTRAGYRETSVHEVTGKHGEPVAVVNMTGPEYEAIGRRLLQEV